MTVEYGIDGLRHFFWAGREYQTLDNWHEQGYTADDLAFIDPSTGELVDGQGDVRGTYGHARAKVGDWLHCAASVSSTVAMTTNREYALPVYVPPGRTIDRIAIEVVTAAAGSTIRMGIRADDDAYPSTLVAEAASAADSATTGEKQVTVAASPGTGWCWIVAKAEGGSPAVYRAEKPLYQAAINAPRLGNNEFPYDDDSARAFPAAWPGARGNIVSTAPFVAVRFA